MLYLIFGPNSFEATSKINEIKKAFLKKNSGFLIEEIDGDDYVSPQDFGGLIENTNLFSQIRLFIFKNTFSKIHDTVKFFKKYISFLKESKDVFLFWERDLKENNKIFEIFQKNAAKIQETKIEYPEKKEMPQTSVFRFVDKIFFSKGAESLLVLEGAKRSGVDSKSLINIIFWKIKKMQKKDKRVLDFAYNAILADLNFKIDSKSEEEHLSRLAISVASKA